MAKSLRSLLIYVNRALVAKFKLRKYAIRENKILAKISESTVAIDHRH